MEILKLGTAPPPPPPVQPWVGKTETCKSCNSLVRFQTGDHVEGHHKRYAEGRVAVYQFKCPVCPSYITLEL